MQEIIIPKGEKENPMSVQEVEEKFLSLAAPVLGDAQARSVIGAVQALADRDSLDELLALAQGMNRDSILRPSSLLTSRCSAKSKTAELFTGVFNCRNCASAFKFSSTSLSVGMLFRVKAGRLKR